MIRQKKETNSLEVKKRRKDLKIRLVSATILSFFTILGILIGVLSTESQRWNLNINIVATNYVFFIVSTFLTGLLNYELINCFKIKEWWAKAILISLVLLVFIFPFFATTAQFPIYRFWKIYYWFQWWQSLLLILVFMIGFAIVGAKIQALNSPVKGLGLAGVALLIVLGMKGFTEISLSMAGNEPKYGIATIIWIWVTIILTDSFGYLGGTRFGKHLLAPKISPKKSVEGAIIGTSIAFIGGSLMGLVVFYLVPYLNCEKYGNYGPFQIPFKNLAANMGQAVPGIFIGLLTFAITVLAQAGDLVFSAIKRITGAKDYSNLIPGHGGLLDRLDSFVFTFFFMFIIVQFI